VKPFSGAPDCSPLALLGCLLLRKTAINCHQASTATPPFFKLKIGKSKRCDIHPSKMAEIQFSGCDYQNHCFSKAKYPPITKKTLTIGFLRAITGC